MANLNDDNELSLEDLMAFADGELDSQGHKRVLELLALYPHAMHHVAFHHQLRQALRESVEARVPAAPADLVAKVRAILAKSETTRSNAESSWGYRLRAWSVALPAVAAALVIALGTIMTMQSMAATQPPPEPGIPILPTIATTALAHQHDLCAKSLENLRHTSLFPQELHKLVPAIAKFLRWGTDSNLETSTAIPAAAPVTGSWGTYTNLDLRPVGYKFVGAGSCMAPGQRSVHVVYQPLDPASQRGPLSIWIEVDNGSLPNLRADMPYATADVHYAAPIVFWKHGGLIYYLVGNSSEGMEGAIHFLIWQQGGLVKAESRNPVPVRRDELNPNSTIYQ